MAERSHVQLVAQEVDDLLGKSHAFRQLSMAQQEQMRTGMHEIGRYLTDPKAHLGDAKAVPAAALAADQKPKDPREQLETRLAEKPGQAGAEFQAGALKQGVEQF